MAHPIPEEEIVMGRPDVHWKLFSNLERKCNMALTEIIVILANGLTTP